MKQAPQQVSAPCQLTFLCASLTLSSLAQQACYLHRALLHTPIQLFNPVQPLSTQARPSQSQCLVGSPHTYTLYRTRLHQLHQSVTFAALYSLKHLKAQFPATKGSLRHSTYFRLYALLKDHLQ